MWCIPCYRDHSDRAAGKQQASWSPPPPLIPVFSVIPRDSLSLTFSSNLRFPISVFCHISKGINLCLPFSALVLWVTHCRSVEERDLWVFFFLHSLDYFGPALHPTPSVAQGPSTSLFLLQRIGLWSLSHFLPLFLIIPWLFLLLKNRTFQD